MLEKLLSPGTVLATSLSFLTAPAFAAQPAGPLPLPSVTAINFAPSDPPPYLNPDNDYSSQQPPKKDEPQPVQPTYIPASTPQRTTRYSSPEASSPAYTPSPEPTPEPYSSKKKSDDILGYILIGVGAGAAVFGGMNLEGASCRTEGYQGNTTCSSAVNPGPAMLMVTGLGVGAFGVWFAVD